MLYLEMCLKITTEGLTCIDVISLVAGFILGKHALL